MVEKEKRHCTAIVLAAGSGKRMGSQIPKQFLPLKGKPVLWYSLQAMEQSPIIEDIILVTGKEDLDFVQTQLADQYGFHKIKAIVAGGAERYESVYQGLLAVQKQEHRSGVIFIHDGARPFLDAQLLQSLYASVLEKGACVAATRVKDTIKIGNASQMVVQTPDRSTLWAVQTPQVFDEELICRAYEQLMQQLPSLTKKGIIVTDDAMVVESMCGHPVALVEGSYRNIKITTPEDMLFAEALLEKTQ